MRIVRVCSNRTIDGLVILSECQDRIELAYTRANCDHALDASIERARHNSIALWLEIRKVEMAVTINQHIQLSSALPLPQSAGRPAAVLVVRLHRQAGLQLRQRTDAYLPGLPEYRGAFQPTAE